MPSQFGQLMSLISAANEAWYTGAKTLITTKKLKGEQRLQEKELLQKGKLQQLDIGFKHKKLAKELEISKRRDTLFKDIALYVGIGVVTLVILITLGVLFIKSKKDERFEYLIKEKVI